MVGMQRLPLALLVLGVTHAVRLDGLRHRLPARKQNFYAQQLENHMNTQYVGDFEIGGQKMKAIYDTGSFEILVLSTRCEECVVQQYDRHKSEHYEKNGTLVRHVFGSGPTISMQASDDVKVGPMVAEHQTFWEIMKHNIQVLDHAAFQAIVGIGPGQAPTNEENTLVMSLGIDTFSVCLEKAPHSPGWLIWGEPPQGNEHHLERSKFLEVDVIGKLHWGANMTGVRGSFANGTVSESVACNGIGCAAIVDSGTSLIAVPSFILDALSPLVGQIDANCDNLDSLPTLTFDLGSRSDGTGRHLFHLPPRAYIMKVNRTIPGLGLHNTATHKADQHATYGVNRKIFDKLYFKPKRKISEPGVECIPAFMMINKQTQLGPLIILGMPFLRYYYASFDRTARQMRFALADDKCLPKSAVGGAASHLHVSSKMGSTVLPGTEPLEVTEDELMVPTWALDDSPSFDI